MFKKDKKNQDLSMDLLAKYTLSFEIMNLDVVVMLLKRLTLGWLLVDSFVVLEIKPVFHVYNKKTADQHSITVDF